MSKQANAKVRAELGGDEAGRRRTEELKKVWPREVVAHCNATIARGMSDSTFEALAAAMEWRTDRGVPQYLVPAVIDKRPRGRPRLTTRKKHLAQTRSRGRAVSRALWRLKARYPEEFSVLYQEERAREAAS